MVIMKYLYRLGRYFLNLRSKDDNKVIDSKDQTDSINSADENYSEEEEEELKIIVGDSPIQIISFEEELEEEAGVKEQELEEEVEANEQELEEEKLEKPEVLEENTTIDSILQDLREIKKNNKSDKSAGDNLNSLIVSNKKSPLNLGKYLKVDLTNDRGLIAVRRPTDQEFDDIAEAYMPIVNKFTTQVETMMESSFDVLGDSYPELKESIQEIKGIWKGQDEEDSENEEDDLDQLDDQERIKIIIERASERADECHDEKEEKGGFSNARKSQNKLSSDAVTNRFTEKIHVLRRNIIKNAADRETDENKRQTILSIGDYMDTVSEGFNVENIGNFLENFIDFGPETGLNSLLSSDSNSNNERLKLSDSKIVEEKEEKEEKEEPKIEIPDIDEENSSSDNEIRNDETLGLSEKLTEYNL